MKGWVCAVRRVSKGCSGDPAWGGHLTSSGWSGRLPGKVRAKLRPGGGGQLRSCSVGHRRHGQQCQLGGWSGQSGGAPRVSKTRERMWEGASLKADTLLHDEQSGWFTKFQNVSSLSPLCMESR